MTFNKVRRFTVSHPCHGVSPWWSAIRITSPGLPTFATLGNPESRASQVAGRRTLFEPLRSSFRFGWSVAASVSEWWSVRSLTLAATGNWPRAKLSILP